MSSMPSKLLSRRDLDFLLYEWLDAPALTARPRYAEHSRETFDAALDASEKLATERFAPHNKRGDGEEPRWDGERVQLIPEVAAALRAQADAGLFAACSDYEFGGMQLPVLIGTACSAWFSAANIASNNYSFLTVAAANLLLAHGSAAQVEAFVRPMLRGHWFGTMCLSETQAGSSLGDIRTRAVPQPDGSHRLFGAKMWISGGEHELAENIVHLVLAKIPDADGGLPAGVQGISLFAVPKRLPAADGTCGERNDVTLAGLNHKMGQRGTVNCVLNFGDGRFRPLGQAGAVGQLVGAPGAGLACMFHMMNEARIAVGVSASVLGVTGYLHALDYARTRLQGRRPGSKDARHPQIPIIEHADVKRMLLAQKAYTEGALGLCLYCARLVDDSRTAGDAAVRRAASLLLDVLTPVTKSWPAQWCVAANDLAIQVHGGYGYTRDYNVEQFYRDNRLNSIHEGTHGIQALDLLGRKVRMQGGAAFELFVVRVRATVADAARAADAELGRHAGRLAEELERLCTTTRALCSDGDTNRALANASIYLEAFGHVTIAWIWLQQALTAARGGGDADGAGFHQGKLAACRYFFAYELPRVRPMLELLGSLDTTTLEMREAWF